MADKTKDKTVVVDDQTFMDQLVNFELTLTDFNHLAQLRVIWFYLTAGWNAGVVNARHQFQRFLNHKGASHEYHATELEFWCKAVWMAMKQDKDKEPAADFEAFLAAHPHLENEAFILKFYSPDVIYLDAAKQRPFPPDLRELDELAAYSTAQASAEEKKKGSKSSKEDSADKKET